MLTAMSIDPHGLDDLSVGDLGDLGGAELQEDVASSEDISLGCMSLAREVC